MRQIIFSWSGVWGWLILVTERGTLKIINKTRLVVDRDKTRNLGLWFMVLGIFLHGGSFYLNHVLPPTDSRKVVEWVAYQILVTAHSPHSPFPFRIWLSCILGLGFGLGLGLGLANSRMWMQVYVIKIKPKFHHTQKMIEKERFSKGSVKKFFLILFKFFDFDAILTCLLYTSPSPRD